MNAQIEIAAKQIELKQKAERLIFIRGLLKASTKLS